MIKKILLLLITFTVLISAQSRSNVIYLYNSGSSGGAVDPTSVSDMQGRLAPAQLSAANWINTTQSQTFTGLGSPSITAVNDNNVLNFNSSGYYINGGVTGIFQNNASVLTGFLAINVTGAQPTGYVTFIDNNLGTTHNWRIEVIAGKIRLTMTDATTNVIISSTSDFSSQGWQVICWQLDQQNKTVNLYEMGELVTNTNAAFVPQNYNAQWNGSRIGTNLSTVWTGASITDIVTYSRLLTISEINGIANFIAAEVGAIWINQ